MSRIPDLIDALVGALRADAALADVTVTDGPEVTDTAAADWLVVGFDGNPDGTFEAATAVGGWASLYTDREEQIQLTVTAVAVRGDTDVRAARQRVYEIARPLEQLLALDPAVGLPSVEMAIESSQLVQEQTAQGVRARLLLMVAGRAFT